MSFSQIFGIKRLQDDITRRNLWTTPSLKAVSFDSISGIINYIARLIATIFVIIHANYKTRGTAHKLFTFQFTLFTFFGPILLAWKNWNEPEMNENVKSFFPPKKVIHLCRRVLFAFLLCFQLFIREWVCVRVVMFSLAISETGWKIK